MKMKMTLLFGMLFGVMPVIATTAPPSVDEAREQVQALGGALKQRLQSAIKQGGLVAAVNECHLAAMPITHSLDEEGWTLNRTALRVRNPDNAPDSWERAQLEHFAQLLEAGQQPPFEASQWDEENRKYRYMRAIITQPVCTSCHGADLSAEVMAAIAQHYPSDQATGFAVGSLRGAFTLRWQSPE